MQFKIKIKYFSLFLLSFLLSSKTFAVCDILDGAYVVSQETFAKDLGFFGTDFSYNSIQYEFGPHGSSWAYDSVKNSTSLYGSGYGTYSAQNPSSFYPPKIYKNNIFIGYLTNNTSIYGGISTTYIDSNCSFISTTPERNPSPITNGYATSTATTVQLNWTGGIGATNFDVYQCTNNDCNSISLLGSVNTSPANIYNLQPNTDFSFFIYASNNYGSSAPYFFSTRTLSINNPVTDTTPPIIELIGDAFFYVNVFDAYIEPGLSATDDIDNDIELFVSGEVNTSILGEYILTYRADDDADNSSMIQRTVSVVDNEPPSLTLNGDNQIFLSQFEVFNDPGAAANDNYDGPISVTTSGNVNTAEIGQYILEYSAEDTSGNISTISRTLIIEEILDATPPNISLVGESIIYINQNASFVDPGVNSLDDVDGNLESSVTGNVDTTNVGEYVLTYTATDSSGNTASIQRTVYVRDITPPNIVLIGESTIYINQNTSYVELGVNSQDDVDGDLELLVSGNVDTTNVGEYVLTYTATDSSGNTANIQRTVIVQAIDANDTDNDGVDDDEDTFPNDSSETADSDNDGVGDNADAFPNDASETADSDNDGVGDNADAFPSDASETADSDNDGVGDNADFAPNDPAVQEGSKQSVFVSGSPKGMVGSPVSVTVGYEVSDDDASLTGLGLRVHYDSSVLTFVEFVDVLATDNISSGQPANDTNNEDGDASTDKYITANWASLFGNWPGTLPADLLTATFNVVDDDSVESTVINFSASSNAASYQFEGTPYTMDILSGSFDFDGNGTADALTDGLMMLRFAFGLTGDGVTNGAIADDSTMTSEEVLAALATAKDSLAADIDGNGNVDALTDGLMLLRALFGLSGDGVTAGAVGDGATRTSAADIEAYIDSMSP
jgi:hypothetical protein